ncbi:MAG: hypothetical protein JXN61_13740 [Sedimentisphaerales bacterium]|nr:hypothetical protein [Sedimentisphaerales bacterium]
MEKHFLSEFVQGEQEFTARPWYNPDGDCIIYQTADEAVVRDRVDAILTMYRSAIDNRPIGFQIKDVRAIIEKFGLDALIVESESKGDSIRSVCLTALLLAAYDEGPKSLERRQAYASAICPPGYDFTMPAQELCEA